MSGSQSTPKLQSKYSSLTKDGERRCAWRISGKGRCPNAASPRCTILSRPLCARCCSSTKVRCFESTHNTGKEEVEDADWVKTLRGQGFVRSHIKRAALECKSQDVMRLLEYMISNPLPESQNRSARKREYVQAVGEFRLRMVAMGLSLDVVQEAIEKCHIHDRRDCTVPANAIETVLAWVRNNHKSEMKNMESSNSSSSGGGGGGRSGGVGSRVSVSTSGPRPTPGRPPSKPQLETKEPPMDTEDLILKFLKEDIKAGRAVSVGQHNYVVMADHKMEQNGFDFTCTLCFDDELTIDKVYFVQGCGHFACVPCMREHVMELASTGKAMYISCSEYQCDHQLFDSDLKRLLTKDQYKQYTNYMLQATLSDDPNCRWCPKPGCGTAMIWASDSKRAVCPRSDCKFAFCTDCKVGWHTDMTCEQFQESKDGTSDFRKWLKTSGSKKCPDCSAPIQKNQGCNHMKCRCGAEFCWLCMQSLLHNGKYKPGHWALFSDSPCYNKMRD